MNKPQRTIEQQGQRDRAAHNLRMCRTYRGGGYLDNGMIMYFLGKYQAYSTESGHNHKEVYHVPLAEGCQDA